MRPSSRSWSAGSGHLARPRFRLALPRSLVPQPAPGSDRLRGGGVDPGRRLPAHRLGGCAAWPAYGRGVLQRWIRVALLNARLGVHDSVCGVRSARGRHLVALAPQPQALLDAEDGVDRRDRRADAKASSRNRGAEREPARGVGDLGLARHHDHREPGELSLWRMRSGMLKPSASGNDTSSG